MSIPGWQRLALSSILAFLLLTFGSAGLVRAAEPVSNWVETERVQFSGTDGFFRSQGVASDGRNLFFSWNLGLSKTEIDDTSVVLADNTTQAIPGDMIETNHNHIGDIDVSDGIIYAPIEDGPKYLAPWIVLYDAETLQPTGPRYLLPADVMRDGVPWIAIDKPRGVAYSMEWGDKGKLFVFSLTDFTLIKTVELDQPVPRIQGAKMFRGLLYASRDNKSVQSFVAIDPETGKVTNLFDRNLGEDYEAEGIAFVQRPTGTMMVSTGIRKGGQGYTEMRVYRIGGDVTAPVLSKASFKQKKTQPGRKLALRLTSSEPVTVSTRWLRCVGPKRKPCSKTKAIGVARKFNLSAGTSTTTVPPNYRRIGKSPVRLRPGRWRLVVTPTDQADIVGQPTQAPINIVKRKR